MISTHVISHRRKNIEYETIEGTQNIDVNFIFSNPSSNSRKMTKREGIQQKLSF